MSRAHPSRRWPPGEGGREGRLKITGKRHEGGREGGREGEREGWIEGGLNVY